MRGAAIALLMLATPVSALELSLSGATEVARDRTDAGSVRLPEGPFDASSAPPEVEGAILRRVLRTSGGTRTTLQLLAPLRDQLGAAGFEPVYSCSDWTCGGFDFRFQLDLIGAPDMYVDLGDYRYLLMRRGAGEPHTVSIVASRSGSAGFVHVTELSAMKNAEVPPAPEAPERVVDTATDPLVERLVADGHVVLADLDFRSGSAELVGASYPSLTALGEWLIEVPGARVALVGHTDNVGGREANQRLSERRAQAARIWLIDNLGIAPNRIEAAGVGYLSPVAPNATEDGRARNRRVEAVLLSLE